MKQDEQEFANLVREERATIYSVCYMFAEQADEVADLFQEVLVRLWQGMASFHGDSKRTTWVYRVALNTCITQDRKRKHRCAAQLSMDVNYFDTHDKRGDQVRMLHDRIIRLQPFDRAIVLLWLEDISYDEIAAIVGITPKNVSVRLARIRQQLKNMQ